MQTIGQSTHQALHRTSQSLKAALHPTPSQAVPPRCQPRFALYPDVPGPDHATTLPATPWPEMLERFCLCHAKTQAPVASPHLPRSVPALQPALAVCDRGDGLATARAQRRHLLSDVPDDGYYQFPAWPSPTLPQMEHFSMKNQSIFPISSILNVSADICHYINAVYIGIL